MTARLLLEVLVAVLVALRLGHRFLQRRRRAAALAGSDKRCPQCSAPRLVATAAITLPGDGEAGVVELSTLACRRCPLRAVGVHAAPASPRGYPMDRLDWARLEAELRRCPAPLDLTCTCAAHQRLGRQEAGRWRGLDEVPREVGTGFVVERRGAE